MVLDVEGADSKERWDGHEVSLFKKEHKITLKKAF